MDVAWWRPVPLANDPMRDMYRPVCRRCLCDAPGHCSTGCSCHSRATAPVVECVACCHPLAYTEPAPDGRGTWRSWLAVCSIGCLNEAKADHEPPPPDPRRCIWCGHEFTPARRGDARLCSARCRQAKRRAQSAPDYDEAELRRLLDDLGIDPDDPLAAEEPLPPRLADAIADALNRMMSEEA